MRTVLSSLLFVLLASGCERSPEFFLAKPGAIPKTLLEIRLAEDSPGPGLREAEVQGDGNRTVYLHDEVLFSNADIEKTTVFARPHPEREKVDAVRVYFTPSGTAKFADVTKQAVGKYLAILLDGKVVCAPFVRAPVEDGQCTILGDFKTKAEAEEVAKGIVGR